MGMKAVGAAPQLAELLGFWPKEWAREGLTSGSRRPEGFRPAPPRPACGPTFFLLHFLQVFLPDQRDSLQGFPGKWWRLLQLQLKVLLPLAEGPLLRAVRATQPRALWGRDTEEAWGQLGSCTLP